MKVIVAGSRTIQDYAIVDRAIQESGFDVTGIVQGDCPTGADKHARTYAGKHGISCLGYPADWNQHGKAAGPKRNEQMARDSGSEALIAVWDGVSRGTKSMIDLARKYQLQVFVFRTDDKPNEMYSGKVASCPSQLTLL